MTKGSHSVIRKRWRFYQTLNGRRPVREFMDNLSLEDRASVAAAMVRVREFGLTRARHLRGEIYEVRVDATGKSLRILFSEEGTKGRILLALDAFTKKTRKTPARSIDLAERRLREWRSRAAAVSRN